MKYYRNGYLIGCAKTVVEEEEGGEDGGGSKS